MFLYSLDGFNSVCTGQLLYTQQNAWLVVGITGNVAAGGFDDSLAKVTNPQRGAFVICQDHVVERFGLGYLVVRRDRVPDLGSVYRALRGIGGGVDEAAPDFLQGQADRSELRGIDLDTDRRFLVAAPVDMLHVDDGWEVVYFHVSSDLNNILNMPWPIK